LEFSLQGHRLTGGAGRCRLGETKSSYGSAPRLQVGAGEGTVVGRVINGLHTKILGEKEERESF